MRRYIEGIMCPQYHPEMRDNVFLCIGLQYFTPNGLREERARIASHNSVLA